MRETPHGRRRAFTSLVLRITNQIVPDSKSSSLKLEGSLRGPWVEELQKAWSAAATPSPREPVKVDLAGVTFADANGCDLLLQMRQTGVILLGASVYLRHILDMQL